MKLDIPKEKSTLTRRDVLTLLIQARWTSGLTQEEVFFLQQLIVKHLFASRSVAESVSCLSVTQCGLVNMSVLWEGDGSAPSSEVSPRYRAAARILCFIREFF